MVNRTTYHNASQSELIWLFNPQGLPSLNVTIAGCELLPHIFTLTLIAQGGIVFCGTICFSEISFSEPRC